MTIHRAPEGDSGLVSCCRKTPFELSMLDQLTTDDDAVTCRDGNIRRMSVNEFVEGGFLMEVNRRFLHPMGLALEYEVEETEGEAARLSGIWDYRDDPEGNWYELGPEAEADVVRKHANVEATVEAHWAPRSAALGFWIQPLTSLWRRGLLADRAETGAPDPDSGAPPENPERAALKEIIDRRRTPEFEERLAHRVEQDQPILDRLAGDAPGPGAPSAPNQSGVSAGSDDATD